MRRGFHSIYSRLFILFLVCMLSLLIIVSGLYYKRSTDQVHQKISDIAQKNVYQTSELFDLLLGGYDTLTKSVTGNFDLQRLLPDDTLKDPAVRAINERSIVNILGANYYSREDIIGIHVVSKSGTPYSYGNYMSVIDPGFQQSDWYRKVSVSTGELVWLGVHEHSVIDQNESRAVFAFGRQMYDLHTHQPVGMVLVETNPQQILAALSNLQLGARSEVYMLSADGEVMAASREEPQLIHELDRKLRLLQEHEVLVEEQGGYMIVGSRPSLADWQFISITPEADLNVELDRMKQYLLVVGSILVVVSTVLATLVSKSFASPLKRLIQEMKQVEMGNFRGGPVTVNSYEEINSLVSSFNQMVGRMDELIERVKSVSTSEKNAQLQALQSQVNPHFLYNTLDMIYWMLDEQEQDKLGSVVLALSNMFRYSSHWEANSVVTLEEELEQIQHYLTIIQLRLDGRLQVDIQVEAQWQRIRLPKMTLQPIIENAVKHGLERRQEAGLLRVYAQADDIRLRLYIEDNGPGMDAAALARLQASLVSAGDAPAAAEASAAPGTAATAAGQSEAADRPAASAAAAATAEPGDAAARLRQGIGLQNVHRRLQLMFGEGYGLDVRSEQGRGTVICISVPSQSGSWNRRETGTS
ncbi:cache domain-containing sensor histidine kinase [Paenibacillus rigui]|uniref:histidine kinase n=1 Tax=Paenibacillus rigui TaxID=554312 RepID=A0A229UJH6_9BACL|nr:sensor histidine kinase [Paenibacillus rigui]OXM83556.1 two-component sensor histidine kinase [Paenibacillus rigui]